MQATRERIEDWRIEGVESRVGSSLERTDGRIARLEDRIRQLEDDLREERTRSRALELRLDLLPARALLIVTWLVVIGMIVFAIAHAAARHH